MTSGTAEPRQTKIRSLLPRRENTSGESIAEKLFVPSILLALCIYLAFASPYFLTGDNLRNILLEGSVLAVVAAGVTFVVLTGEFDLSVGSGVALAGVAAALAMRDTGSILIGLLTALFVGVAVGCINGLIVTRLQVPSFIVTLGMLTVARGVALNLADGEVVTGLPPRLNELANTTFLGLELPIWIMIAVFAALYFVQSRTAFGIKVFATGGNREAARLVGIGIDRIRIACFMISGLAVGIAAMILTARVDSGQPNSGLLLELDAVAAIVIGGTSLFGGRGSVIGTLWGVLFISTLQNGLDLLGVQDDLKAVIIGTVFILAASSDFFRRQLRQRQLRRIGREAQQPGATDDSAPPSGAELSVGQLPTPSGVVPEDRKEK